MSIGLKGGTTVGKEYNSYYAVAGKTAINIELRRQSSQHLSQSKRTMLQPLSNFNVAQGNKSKYSLPYGPIR